MHFEDLPYVLDYTEWLRTSIDPTIQLAVKGPISQLLYIFDGNGDEVVTSTRPFPCPADTKVPIILPDYSSKYYSSTNYKADGKRIDTSGAQLVKAIAEMEDEDQAEEVAAVNAMYESNVRQEVKQESNYVLEDENQAIKDAMGLKAFNLINTEHKLGFSISNQILDATTLKVAEFEEGPRAHLPYSYARSILNSDTYTSEKKQEVREWMSEMPTPPTDIRKGFPKGSAEHNFPVFTNMFERVLELSKKVRRPEANAYTTMQGSSVSSEPLEDLPHLELACDSTTSDQVLLNRAIMKAYPTGDPASVERAIVLKYKLNQKKEKMKRKAAKAAKAAGNNIPRSSTCTSAVVTSKSKTSNTRQEDQEDHADDDDDDDDDEEDHDGANEDHNDDGDDLGDDDSEDEADGEGYWSGTYSKKAPTVLKYVQVLTEASSKKYKLNHIDLLSSIVLNNTLIRLKSDAEVKDIPSRSFGIVTGDEVKNRARRLTVQFLKKECVISYVQAFLATEI